MKSSEYVESMIRLLHAFQEEQDREHSSDDNYRGWNQALYEYIDSYQGDFCPTCAGEGYLEEQTDVDCFKPYPCGDCQDMEAYEDEPDVYYDLDEVYP